MNNVNKKIISFIMICFFVFSASTVAFAAEPTQTEVSWNFSWFHVNNVISETITLTTDDRMVYGVYNHTGDSVNVYVMRQNTDTGTWYTYRSFTLDSDDEGAGYSDDFVAGYYQIAVTGSFLSSSTGTASLRPFLD